MTGEKGRTIVLNESANAVLYTNTMSATFTVYNKVLGRSMTYSSSAEAESTFKAITEVMNARAQREAARKKRAEDPAYGAW